MSKLKQLLFSLNETDRRVIEEKLKEKDQQIDQVKQQLAEKDKEIEELKLKLDIRAMSLQNINTERMESEQNQTQLAIQELEKLRNDIWELDIGDYYFQNGGILENIKIKRADVLKLMDQQIKELKGE